MTAMAEGRGTVVQKGLSEWWNEETEYVFQRIERWAAFARGYNRLRSQKWSKDRQQTQEHHQDSLLHVSAQKSSIDEATCTSRFYNFERSRLKTRPEETRINCCGTFNYQSNSELDSNCLEMYRYDYSIYFKTIGDIRNDRKDVENCEVDRVSISSEELVEWDVNSLSDLVVDKSIAKETYNNNLDNNIVLEAKTIQATQNVWPIVDLAKLNLNLTDSLRLPGSINQNDQERDEERQNNNVEIPEVEHADLRLERTRRIGGTRFQKSREDEEISGVPEDQAIIQERAEGADH